MAAGRLLAGSALLLAGLLLAERAQAQASSFGGSEPGPPNIRAATRGKQQGPSTPPGATVWQRANLFGELGGVRERLRDLGIGLDLTERSEALGNVTGGARQGAIYEGITQLVLTVNTETAFGLPGGLLNASALHLHGRGLSANNLGGNLNTASGIEPEVRGTLLYELWYQQGLLGDRLSVRAGQVAVDREYLISTYAKLFLNNTFGWPTLPQTNLPSGGPVFPLPALGAHVRAIPRDDLVLLAGVFNGDPAGPGTQAAQLRNPDGTAFRLRDGVFAIAEAQFGINQGQGATDRPGTYKIGAWYNVARPPTGPASAGRFRTKWSFYGIADQLIWRVPGNKDGGIGVFARVMGGFGEYDLVNFYADAGVTWRGPLPGRDHDTIGLGFGIARVNNTAANLTPSAPAAARGPSVIGRHEGVLELTYHAYLTPWWEVQPDAQYLFNLASGVQDPLQPARRLGDAAVFGLRTTITF